ncbi:MAG: putative quinol monooxygenase [Thermodesulfobacteriota bacterium]|nr:putative quinol monooxygenase [Thermodesulfobacteriota bacterium]
MIVVSAVIKAQAGKEKEMEDALKSMIPKVQSEEGTLAYVLHRALNDPTKFFFYEKYKDQAAFDFHGSTPHIAELFGKIGPLLDGQPTIDMYEELAAK